MTDVFLNSLLTENGEQAPYELGGFPMMIFKIWLRVCPTDQVEIKML